MTDNEIIKALECCISSGFDECLQCPLHNDFYPNTCHYERTKMAADLINRQKAEIVELQKRIINWRKDMDYRPDEIKSEAIKEFAERLKKEYHGFDERYEQIFYSNLITAIDDLVKEMRRLQVHTIRDCVLEQNIINGRPQKVNTEQEDKP